MKIRCSVLFPAESKPLDTVLDRIDEFLIFLGRIGIVEAQMATTCIVSCQTEVQTDRFGMSDMKITVRFRRKTGDDFGHPRTSISAFFVIGFDNGTQKIGCWRGIAVFVIGVHDLNLKNE